MSQNILSFNTPEKHMVKVTNQSAVNNFHLRTRIMSPLRILKWLWQRFGNLLTNYKTVLTNIFFVTKQLGFNTSYGTNIWY